RRPEAAALTATHPQPGVVRIDAHRRYLLESSRDELQRKRRSESAVTRWSWLQEIVSNHREQRESSRASPLSPLLFRRSSASSQLTSASNCSSPRRRPGRARPARPSASRESIWPST